MPFKRPHQTADTTPESNNIIKKPDGSFEIKPKGLNIIWGNDLRYWKTITNEGAELIQVSWLEVSGKVGPVKDGEIYVVEFDIAVKDTGFGWGNTEVLVMAKTGKRGSYDYKAIKLNCGDTGKFPRDDNKLVITVKKPSKLEPGETQLDLHFGLYEVWSGKWKGGLIIKKAYVTKQS